MREKDLEFSFGHVKFEMLDIQVEMLSRQINESEVERGLSWRN